jgi:spermidine synthase
MEESSMECPESKLWLSDAIGCKRDTQHHHHEKPQVKNEPTPVLISPQEEPGNIWDKISLKSLKKENHQQLYRGKSQFQEIEVVEAKDIRMYLNEQLQFSSLDERIYHEAFVHIPFSLTEKHTRVLILGGGDGLALREVLKYSDVKHVDLVDIDSRVLSVARNVPEMVILNNRSMHDRRVKVHAQNALDFLKNNKKTYDLIIIDFPDPADEVLANLYTVEVFQKIHGFLENDGMMVCQSNSPEDTPVVYWSIGLTIEQASFYTKGYHTIVPSFGDWGFHLACKKPIHNKCKNVRVSHKTLPHNLESLFEFKSNILAEKRQAIVNRENQLQLHEVYNQEVI